MLTRCDLGLNYIINPASRGGGCTIWPIQDGTCAYCSCPFCIRDTGGLWGFAGAGEVAWASNSSSTSSVMGEAVVLWRGTQANGNRVEHAVSSATGLPVTQTVSQRVGQSPLVSATPHWSGRLGPTRPAPGCATHSGQAAEPLKTRWEAAERP